MVHKYSSYGTSEPETIEVRHEQIAAGLPVLLHVRRGSESALNQLLPDTGQSDNNEINASINNEQTKRWSAAAPLSQEPRERYIAKRSDGPSSYNKKCAYAEEDENEERDLFPPRRSASSGFLRDGSNRLSMQFIGDTAGGLKWFDAADRVTQNKVFSSSLPREHRKKEPLCQANSNPVSSLPNDVKNHYDSTEYIVLKMDKEALGIHVVPDYDQCGRDRGLLVQRIESGGKVDRDGRLSVCDRIVEINDKNLLNQPFNAVQEIFRDSLRSAELRLRVVKHRPPINECSTSPVKKTPPPPVYPKPSSNAVTKYARNNKENIVMVEGEEHNRNKSSKIATVSPTKKTSSAVAASGGNILMAVNTRKIGKKVEIELIKSTHGLGFSITTRDNPVGGNCPIYIKNILPKGAAVEDGRLKCGDRLLSVNGNDVTGKSQSEVVSELRNVPMGGKVKLIISRQEDVISKSVETPEADDTTEVITNHKMQATVPNGNEKQISSQGVDHSSIFPWRQKEILTFDIPVHDTEKAGLGISVKGKTSTNAVHKQGNDTTVDMGIFINSILHGGAASRDGRLKTNDQLLNVNGVSLLGQSNSSAMDTLRRAILHTEGPKPGAITLTVGRKINSGHNKQRRDSSSSLLTDSSGSHTETFGRSETDYALPTSTNNSGNSEASDNTVIFVAPKPQNQLSTTPDNSILPMRNPVVERLTGQETNHNGLRNESYYRAAHATMLLVGKDGDRLTSPTVNHTTSDMVIIEEDAESAYSRPPMENNAAGNIAASGQQRGSTSTQATDATYCSQLSLEEAAAGFSRDAFGRQSMSEKRHATLDAKSTDTYQRNKRIREEREKQKSDKKVIGNGLAKVNSTESIPRSVNRERNDIVHKNQLGPSLGMKKSSSLESLQTMVQEIQMADDCGPYRRSQVPVKVVRGRGCNESFRAAVDRSYEDAHRYQTAAMETLAEDDGACHFMPRQSSLNSQLDCKLIKQQQHAQKKKSSILKGLGSMFRFGRHRKPAVLENISAGVGKPNYAEEEKELARRAAIEEQQRIQEQYKILMQRQMDKRLQQQQQQQKLYNQPYIREIPATLPNPNVNVKEQIHNERFNQLRISQTRPNYDRRNNFISQDVREDYYEGTARKSFRQSEFEPRFTNTARLSGRQVYTSNELNRFSHYVNYEEIQQQINRRQQQHYHSQRRDSREIPNRPVSNFYEYESVQAVIQNYGAPSAAYMSPHPPAPPVDINCNSIPRTEFFPAAFYGSRNQPPNRVHPFNCSQNANIAPSGAATNYHRRNSNPQQTSNAIPLYSNLPSAPSKSQGPYVTQITITDNSHYTTTSLGTKV